jgi:outer membrane biosynthesis protein TonB
VPDRRSIFRLLALAGFLLTVALALWLAEVRPLIVVIVMGIALLVAWIVEWLSWRQDVMRLSGEAVEVAGGGMAVPLVPPAPERPVEEPQEAVAAPAPPPTEVDEAGQAAPEPEPTPEPEPEPEPELPPVQPVVPEPVASPPEPAAPPPAPEPLPPTPEPARPVLRPVPAPASPSPAAPTPQRVRPPAASTGVVDLRTRVTAQPRRWNLWDLERRARDEAQRDPLRYEEWSYLFVHLRQFATPDGSLPTEFDGLVRESFGELLDSPVR